MINNQNSLLIYIFLVRFILAKVIGGVKLPTNETDIIKYRIDFSRIFFYSLKYPLKNKNNINTYLKNKQKLSLILNQIIVKHIF
jgi:hypothetical protein